RAAGKLADQTRADWLETGPAVPSASGDGTSLPSTVGELPDHDHRTAPRRVYQSHIAGTDARNVRRDTYFVQLEDHTELYAGVVVPVEVWPETDRVTAGIWS